MIMNKFAYTASTMFAALALATAAQAADMTAPATYDWTGFYVGANAGIAWNNSSLDQDVYDLGDRIPGLGNSIDGDQTAFTAGGLLGYNYQIDQIVLGVEADINYLGFGDSNKNDVSEIFQADGAYSRTSFEADWFGTIRARLGFAVDNVLIYGTGGAAYGHMEADGKLVVGDNVWKGSTEATNWGWTVGAGAEYGIDNWSLGLEYLYVDLGDAEWDSNVIEDNKFKGSADYAFSTVRATVKYRFQ
jgi:outer membrane immunogenic protein